MKKYTLIIAIVSLLIPAALLAVPAAPGLISVRQPDGSRISFRLSGDEHFHYATTADDFLIERDERGIFRYARLDERDNIVLTPVQAHDPGHRTRAEQTLLAGMPKAEALQQALARRRAAALAASPLASRAVTPQPASFPLTGSPRAIIILVSFADIQFSTPRQSFDDLANQLDYSANGGTGSIRDYFREASAGAFNPVFDVYGPYTLQYNESYYDNSTSQMVLEAASAALADGVDFAQYDTDNDGTVDNIFIYYAGNNEAEGAPSYTIWPHRSVVSSGYDYSGKRLRDYACTSEFRSTGRTMCGIGTFCHEFSHVLGLPDFYDTNSNHGAGQGISAMGAWDIMTSGNYNNNGRTPPTYTAYERFMMGWLTPRPLTDADTVDCEGIYRLHSLISSNEAYIISATPHNLNGSRPSPNEFFMLEYRRLEGRDTHTGTGEGLLATHIYYNASDWTSNGPNNSAARPGYYPVTPFGSLPATGSDRDTYPGSTGTDHIELVRRDIRDTLARRIVNITDYDSCCEFGYMALVERLDLGVRDIEAQQNTVTVPFHIAGHSINGSIRLTLAQPAEFGLRLHSDTAATFASLLILTADTAGFVDDTVDVQYAPTRLTYDQYRQNSLIAKGVNETSLMKVAPFRYRNRRPVYITAPVALPACDITANSATGVWSFVPDTVAEARDVHSHGARYLVDLYTVNTEPQTETETFEEFPEKMLPGWSTTFTTVSTTYKMGTRAALLATAADTIYSAAYISDIRKASLWIKSVSARGMLRVEAQTEATGEWLLVKQIAMDNSTGGDYNLSLSAGYRRLRISFDRTAGSVAVDNVSVTTDATVRYICRDLQTADTTFVFTGLEPGAEYRYVVRATDCDTVGTATDPKPRYCNTTEASNEILFTTGVRPAADDGVLPLIVAPDAGGQRYIVSIPEPEGEDYRLFVYTADGITVAVLQVNDATVTLPELPKGFYILKYTTVGHNRRGDRYVKFYYNIEH